VFLPDCTLDFAQQIGEMLRRQCAGLTYARGDGTVQASVSVGAAELPEDSPNRLAHGLANAEIACKAAKDRGRDRVEIFRTPTRASCGAAPTSWWCRPCTRRSRRTGLRCSRSRSCR
jgi:hypothetical protein